ncbi:MAG: M42 family metallopeptidase [Anaerolineales bacterium]|jgi:endoglucanase
MKSLIQKLTETFSPSGYESAIREVIRGEVEALADEVRVDALGNLIVRKGTKGKNGQRIMLAAHMDEIGLIATHIDENGFIRFTSLGFVRPLTLVSGRVHFANGTQGLVGMELDLHATEFPALRECYIDVGATSAKDCPVKVGDVAAFERPCLDLGRRLVAKSMDDRIGCAVLIETLRTLKSTPHELYFVFSTQEEVGTRGAGPSAFGIDPDIGLAVDVTLTGDTPRSKHMAISLGKGPAVKIKDTGMLADPRLVEWMCTSAEKQHIPYQREVLEGGSTDARAIQMARSGVPAGCLSIPCRYVHTPSEMVDYEDVQNAVKLLTGMLSALINL